MSVETTVEPSAAQLLDSYRATPSPAGDPFLDDFLPVASVQANLDHYFDQWNRDNFIGNILEDIVLVRCAFPEPEAKPTEEEPGLKCATGNWFVISSDIDSKYNCGYITKYSRLEDIPSSSASLFLNPGYGPCSSVVSLCDPDSGLSKCAPSSLLCGFDSGHVLLLDDNLVINEVASLCHNQVTTIRANTAKTEAVVADFDGRIVLLDLTTFQPLAYLDQAHAGPINDLQLNPVDNSLLLSAGADNEVLLWDNRCQPDAVLRLSSSTIVVTVSSQPTALCWSPNSSKQFLLGTEMGNLVHYDLRASKVIQNKPLFNEGNQCGGNRIHLIKPLKLNQAVAIGADQSSELLFYRADLSECLHREQYPNEVCIRSCLETCLDQDPDKPRLVAIGTKRSVFVHDNILGKL